MPLAQDGGGLTAPRRSGGLRLPTPLGLRGDGGRLFEDRPHLLPMLRDVEHPLEVYPHPGSRSQNSFEPEGQVDGHPLLFILQPADHLVANAEGVCQFLLRVAQRLAEMVPEKQTGVDGALWRIGVMGELKSGSRQYRRWLLQ